LKGGFWRKKAEAIPLNHRKKRKNRLMTNGAGRLIEKKGKFWGEYPKGRFGPCKEGEKKRPSLVRREKPGNIWG